LIQSASIAAKLQFAAPGLLADVLAAKIEQVHRAYGLNGKVTATVTDNGSNFVKAFISSHKCIKLASHQ